MALSFGPAPVAEALAAAGPARRGEGHGRPGLRPAIRRQAPRNARRPGCCTRARAAGVDSTREAGQLIEAAGGAQTVAFVELHAGAPESAEKILRASIAELDRLGNLSYRGTTTLMLADILAPAARTTRLRAGAPRCARC